MRDVLKSFLSFSWGLSLFGMRQAMNLASPERAAAAFDSVARAAAERMGEPLGGVFQQGDRLQRQVIDAVFGAAGESGPAPAGQRPAEEDAPDQAVDAGRLNPVSFVVLGEGLAAGMGDFGLKSDTQRWSFPARIARRLGMELSQPLIQPPGIGDLPGFPRLPVRAPAMMQDTVLEVFPPAGPPRNLSVPGFRLRDALELRPAPPVVHRQDARRTAANLILGMPGLLQGAGSLPTQLEVALSLHPTFALVALGYFEALEAATRGEPGLLPSAAEFQDHLSRLVASLRGVGAEVLVMTVPDPLDTAHFSPLDAAGRVLRVEASALARTYGLRPGDRITVRGLVEIGGQLLTGTSRPLPEGCVLGEVVAERLRAGVAEMNRAVAGSAREHDAVVHDLHGLFREARERGIPLAARRLTADYLGGFYSLNGYYPGRAGHAVIAEDVVRHLNMVYGARLRSVDLSRAAAGDPVVRYRPPGGGMRTELPPVQPAAPPPPAQTENQGTGSGPRPASRRLELPPGLEQTLPLSRRASYHGDAIRIIHTEDERAVRFGATGDLFFGGLVLYDSHLTGQVHIRFTPPVGDVTRFEVRLGQGLTGEDAPLVAPQLFRWPVTQARVLDAPGVVSSGQLNLATGEVSDLQVQVFFLNSALAGLIQANPGFPRQPIAFPGQYGSAWARFDPRPDGNLDFTFYGTTFLPLGARLGNDPVLWALPFSSPDGDFASMPASGMAMHPHLHLSTREPAEGGAGSGCPELPFNSIQELTLFTRNSSFGDQFTLEAEELGGYAKGRSHVLGRLEVQIGERSGDSVPIAVSSLAPGGLLANTVPAPLAQTFPGRLYPGPVGHNEVLRFPLRSYFLDAVNFIDDPFDLAVGSLDLRTGELRNEFLRRGLIGQDLFFALVRVEPRTPQSTFLFRGPARLERGPAGEPVFRLKAEVHIPYPPGFLFPAPDLATGFAIGPGSALDPFLWLHASGDAAAPEEGFQAEGTRVRASTGEEFSYRCSIPPGPDPDHVVFEYTNHDQDGTFRLHTLSWLSFVRSPAARGGADTVSFTGYGTWSKDGGRRTHAVSAQIACAPDVPYVSIQIDGALVSNVNTKPKDEKDALP